MTLDWARPIPVYLRKWRYPRVRCDLSIDLGENMPTGVHERAALLALLSSGSSSWNAITKKVIAAGSAQAVADLDGLSQMGLFDAESQWDQEIEKWSHQINAWEVDGLALTTITGDDFPSRLLDVKQPPPLLFSRGGFDSSDADGISIIGSRKASADGLKAARSYARELSAAGVVIISGLAAGVDTQAHQGVLEVNGRTVAVVGTGLNKFYPAENQDLQTRIGDTGLLLSQFLPDAPPTKISFPLRNALMSAWGQATLVIEAGEQSGARLQARLAVEQGRKLLLHDRLVGEVWAQTYLQQGVAQLVANAADVLTLL